MRRPIPPKKTLWRRWFAWYPVNVSGQQVWLEWIWRRKEFMGYFYDVRHSLTDARGSDL